MCERETGRETERQGERQRDRERSVGLLGPCQIVRLNAYNHVGDWGHQNNDAAQNHVCV